jgi:hypothetical protein
LESLERGSTRIEHADQENRIRLPIARPCQRESKGGNADYAGFKATHAAFRTCPFFPTL